MIFQKVKLKFVVGNEKKNLLGDAVPAQIPNLGALRVAINIEH